MSLHPESSMESSAAAPKKRIRRWAKRPADPNHDANAFLSVMDVQLIIRELESYERRIAPLKGRDYRTAQRRARRLIEKLYAVRWT